MDGRIGGGARWSAPAREKTCACVGSLEEKNNQDLRILLF